MAFIGPRRPDPPDARPTAVRRGLLAGLAGLALAGQPVPWHSHGTPTAPQAPPDRHGPVADFGPETPAPAARWLADAIAASGDHQGLPFFLIDKANATLYVFDRQARLQGSAPVLLGAATGDDSVPDIGTRPIAQIDASERTTPAGRFVAEVGHNLKGEDIVWVDHGAAISMHRVRTTQPQERRAERLATPGVDDNRISYGCINVPTDFYNRHVKSAFDDNRTAIAYVMPEVRALHEQFAWLVGPAQQVARRR